MVTMPRCCKPSEYDDDRTHTVRYRQVSMDDGEIEWEDGGTAEIACTHNDAIAIAELVAAGLSTGLKPRGKHGTWIGSEITEGDGLREEVWVSRGPGEEDYDTARLAAMAAEGWTVAGGSLIPPPPPWPHAALEVS